MNRAGERALLSGSQGRDGSPFMVNIYKELHDDRL